MKDAGINSLSRIEVAIIEYLRKGQSHKVISDALQIPRGILDLYQYQIAKKLGVKKPMTLPDYLNNSQLQLDESAGV